MDWEAISAVAEMLGLIAVVISLVYLAIQVRTQIREARLAAMHEISVGLRELNASFIADPEMAVIFDKGNNDFIGLENHEKIRLAVCLQGYFRLWEEAFMQYEAKRLDERIWDTIVRQFASFLAAPSVQQVWDQRKSYYDKKFKQFVESLPRTSWGID